METIISFLVGMFIGAAVGIVLAAVLHANQIDDE